MTRHLTLMMVIALGFILIAIGCTTNASDISATVAGQLENGAPIYAQNCATITCHGTQGEGIRAGDSFKVWPLVGDELQSRQENAFTTFGGSMSGEAQGGLFPPSDNAILIDMPPTRTLPIAAQNQRLHLQLDQIAQASVIGNTEPREGGPFLIVVIVFSDLDDQPITLSADHLKLSTSSGELLEPQTINIHSALEKFHERTIKPQHGTVGLVVFTLSTPEDFEQLIYDDRVGDRIAWTLKP